MPPCSTVSQTSPRAVARRRRAARLAAALAGSAAVGALVIPVDSGRAETSWQVAQASPPPSPSRGTPTTKPPTQRPTTRLPTARPPSGALCIGGRAGGGGCACPGGTSAARIGATIVCRPRVTVTPPPRPRPPSGRPTQPDGETRADLDRARPRDPSPGRAAPADSAPRHTVLPPPSGPVRLAPSPPSVAASPIPADEPFVPDEVVGTLAEGTPPAVDEDIAAAFNLVLVERIAVALTGERLLRYRIPDRRPVPDVVAALTLDARLGGPQPNYVYVRQGGGAGGTASAAPPDLQYALAKLDVAGAHRLARGAGVVVAVLDTGVDAKHPDLAGVVTAEIDVTGQPASASLDAHGTAIAGVIAARGVVKGVAPMAQVLSVRTFRPGVAGARAASTSALVVAGVDRAVAHGAKVLNLSFAGAEDPLLRRLLQAAIARHVLVVAAAGNSGPAAPPAYPAAYPEVIAVTATDHGDQLYAKANHGAHIAVAAPGVDVLTLGAARSHGLQSGTSFAAAHVSGILALVVERMPALTPAAARAALVAAAVDLGAPGHDAAFGAGRANAAGTLGNLATAAADAR